MQQPFGAVMQIAKIYRSQPTSCALTTAVGYCGDMQIELIRLKDPDQRELEQSEQYFLACYDSADYREGIRAFAEKCKPKFVGR